MFTRNNQIFHVVIFFTLSLKFFICQPYLSSIAKHNWFSMDLEAVSEYFSLGTVMEVY